MAQARKDSLDFIPAPEECPPFFIAYIRYMSVFLNRSSLTTESVYQTLREFFQYIHFEHKYHTKPSGPDDHKGMDISLMTLEEAIALNPEDIEEYLCFLDTVVKNNPRTIQKKISQMEKFYDYLIGHQEELGIRIWQNPVKGLAVPTHLSGEKTPVPISPGDLKKLLEAIDGENAIRDKAIVILIVSTGLKLSEVASLDIDDFCGTYIRLQGKRPRNAALNDTCIRALEVYLREYRDPIADLLKDDALFTSTLRKKRITPRCIQIALEKHFERAGLADKSYTANSLRYTAIHAMLDACSDHEVQQVMEYMGLKSQFSARRYTAARQNDIALRARSLDIIGGQS